MLGEQILRVSKRFKIAVLFGLVFLIFFPSPARGQWPMFRKDPAHTGSAAGTGPEGAFLKWTYETDSYIMCSPAVVNDRVYVGSYDDYLYCLDAENGSLLWKYSIGNVRSSPAVVNGRVYVGSWDTYLYCLDADNGSLIWRYETGDRIESSPNVVNNRVYVGSYDNYVYCLNAENGSLVWKYLTGWWVGSSPAVADGSVFIGSGDTLVYCLRADNGSLIWSYKTGGGVYSSPAFSSGRIYVGSYDGHIYCLNSSTGTQLWDYQAGDFIESSPAVSGNRLYIGSNVDIWGYVGCLDTGTGNPIWTYQMESLIFSSPAAVDDKVYVGSHDDHIYCLGRDVGNLVWKYETDGHIYSSPAVFEGKIYIGSTDNHVYCLEDDLIPPEILITSPSSIGVYFWDVPVLRWLGSDNYGIQEYVVYINGSILANTTENSLALPDYLGVLNLTVVARDYAGNESTESKIITIGYDYTLYAMVGASGAGIIAAVGYWLYHRRKTREEFIRRIEGGPLPTEPSDKFVVIDGSNVAWGHGSKKMGDKPSAQNIRLVAESLKDKGFKEIVAIVGASLRHSIEDKQIFNELKKEGILLEAPAETDADSFIIKYTKRKNAFVVSNDAFRDWKEKDSWIDENIDRLRIRFLIKGKDVIFYEDLDKIPKVKDKTGRRKGD